jgi:hypothetical protein
MNSGYLILSQNNNITDYLKLAYVNALSIKLTQKTINNVSLVTDVIDAVPEHYQTVFDKIIEIPWYDDALKSEWKIENRWKLYHASPYDETVVLDADMLFLSDVSHWWNYLKNHEMCFVNKVKTYRNTFVTDDLYYRKAILTNNLPNTYSAFLYFKKSDLSKDFWELTEHIVKNYTHYYNIFLKNEKTDRLSMDVVFSIAVYIMGIQDTVFSKFDYPTFVHMKSMIQDWKKTSHDWRNHVGAYINNNAQVKIGNYLQSGILHYTDKTLITDEIMYVYENLFKEKYNNV